MEGWMSLSEALGMLYGHGRRPTPHTDWRLKSGVLTPMQEPLALQYRERIKVATCYLEFGSGPCLGPEYGKYWSKGGLPRKIKNSKPKRKNYRRMPGAKILRLYEATLID